MNDFGNDADDLLGRVKRELADSFDEELELELEEKTSTNERTK